MRLRCGQVAALLLLLVAACGKSEEHKVFDRFASECSALAGDGATIDDALIMMAAYQGAYVGQQTECRPDYVDLQQCPHASADAPYCRSEYFFLPGDPAACNQGRCVCMIEFAQADLDTQGNAAPLCASRFLRGQ
ncbi:MAG: hypothetical protein QM767_12495 [Anaeromyxobacter sp.]